MRGPTEADVEMAGDILSSTVEYAERHDVPHARMVWAHLTVALNLVLYFAPKGQELDVLRSAGDLFESMISEGEEALEDIRVMRENADKIRQSKNHEPGHA